MDINATFWHRVPIVVDYCTKYEQNKRSIHSLLQYCNKHIKFKKNIAIITQMWHRAKSVFHASAMHGT